MTLDANDLSFFLRRDFLTGEEEDDDDEESEETVALDLTLDLVIIAVVRDAAGSDAVTDTAGTVGTAVTAVTVGTGLEFTVDVAVAVAVETVAREYVVADANVDTGTADLTPADAFVVAER